MTIAEKKAARWLTDATISQSQYDEFKKAYGVLKVVDVELSGMDLVVILDDGSRLKISHKATELPPVDVTTRKEYWTILGITMKIYQWVILFAGLGALLAVAAILLTKRQKT